VHLILLALNFSSIASIFDPFPYPIIPWTMLHLYRYFLHKCWCRRHQKARTDSFPDRLSPHTISRLNFHLV
jgi:hypothetical protein